MSQDARHPIDPAHSSMMLFSRHRTNVVDARWAWRAAPRPSASNCLRAPAMQFLVALAGVEEK